MSRRQDEINQSDGHNARGIELADRGWLDEAACEFRKAIELDSRAVHAHDNLGTVLAEKGELLDALSEFMLALQSDPSNPSAHHYLASFLAAHAQDLAVEEFRAALNLEDHFPDAHLNLALALAEKGHMHEAAEELALAHAQAPDDEHIEHELACCLVDVDRHTEAIRHLKNILRTHPEHIDAYVDLGIAFTAQGFFAEAESTFKNGIAIDPSDFACHYHLAALYAAWGRKADAIRHLATATEHDHDKAARWAKDDRLFDNIRVETEYKRLF